MDAAAVAIVPARMGSTRLPGKALLDATGLPLVVHVAHAASRASTVRRVVVAAEDRAIVEACARHDVEAVLTAVHPNGTSRLDEAARLLGLADDAIVVNVQGDEPEIEPTSIDAAVARFVQDDRPDVATLAAPIRNRGDEADPNVVKVVLDASNRALYFSRATVPHDRDGVGVTRLRHVGLYVYSAAFLRRYVAMPETPLERAERLEQLRVLEHGGSIGVALVDDAHPGIDTPEQYDTFVARWRASAGQPSDTESRGRA
ncbi:MAG: 3-deoxy-manno-octulosonate cytidylyltransferase [Phycisphaerales bacterium]